jgi:hypothetical protein
VFIPENFWFPVPLEDFDSVTNPNAAMPLAQFADPWRKVQIKQETEVSYFLFVLFSNH